LWLFSIPPYECRESTSKLGHDRFLPDPFQFIIHVFISSFTFRPSIRRYIVSVTENASLNKLQKSKLITLIFSLAKILKSTQLTPWYRGLLEEFIVTHLFKKCSLYWYPKQHTYIHTYVHTYIHTYICRPTYVHTYIRTYIHTYVRTYIHAYICTYVHTYVRGMK
jgi:hypothetical protein